jgi:glycosyltransferase involved in cell wall biosynthesis
MRKIYKIGIFTPHPIQYQTPLFRYISNNGEIYPIIYFQNKLGVDRPVYDPEFGQQIKWDIPLLEGYESHFLEETSNLRTIFKKNKFDAIIIHGWNSLFNLKVIFFAELFKATVMVRAESPLNQELLKGKNIKQFLRKIFLKTFFKFVDKFLYIGEENRRLYEHYGVPKDKLVFTPYSVENDRFFAQASEFAPKKNEFRKELKIENNDFVILFVGKFIDKKRPMDLLRAYAGMKYDKKALVFVGEGKLRPELENFVKSENLKNVHFVGFKNQTEVGKYYSLSDVFVLPSDIGETWGLVVNEAMCFGLPIIVSDIVGCALDLVKNEENGLIVSLGDADAITIALEKLANDKEKRREFGKKSAEMIKNYSYRADTDGIINAFSGKS